MWMWSIDTEKLRSIDREWKTSRTRTVDRCCSLNVPNSILCPLPSLLSLSVCFLCSAAGLDASNQASTHELTIPNDVSAFFITCKMSSCDYFSFSPTWIHSKQDNLIQNERFVIQKTKWFLDHNRQVFLKRTFSTLLQRYCHTYSAVMYSIHFQSN